MPRDRLSDVLDRLLPGNADGWPAAGGLGLEGEVRGLWARPMDDGSDPDRALDALLAALGPGFDTGGEAAEIAALEALEAAEPVAFGRLVAAAYTAYYVDPRVRAVVEARTGYPARPPQPDGYPLPPFDDALLATQRRRAPFWRSADPEDGR
jgi:hypothetical protein